jgi:hypothetical protein
MNNSDFQTPIHDPKTRILGLTIPQLLLLGGMGLVQLVILVLALKYIVFAPPPEIIPTVTPVAITPLALPTPTATPIPDFSTAMISSGDLPVGFVAAPDDPTSFDFNKLHPNFNIHPVDQFAFYQVEQGQYVIGWFFVLTNPQERDKFSAFVRQPVDLLVTSGNPGDSGKSIDPYKLANPYLIGELSTGWSADISSEAYSGQSDFVLFSYKNLGGIIEVRYQTSQTPLVDVWDVATLLNDRLMRVLESGPIPTPVVIPIEDLGSVKLSQEDVPAGFEPVPDADIPVDEVARAQMAADGMQIVSTYGYRYPVINHEEFVIGYTFSFSNTMGTNAMDAALSSDPVVFALLPPERVEKILSSPINKSIGDRFLTFAFMEVGGTVNQRIDMIVFRRGYVGVVLYHAHYLGMWQTTLEDPAIHLDIKIQTLATP